MNRADRASFNAIEFLTTAGMGRRVVEFRKDETFFVQGDPADSVIYLQRGQAKVCVVSESGKEATLSLVKPGDFMGEEAMTALCGQRLATATALAACTVLKIQRKEMIRVIHDEAEFSDLFVAFLLKRSMRTQADLVDQLFNSSEKRLARMLLVMGEFGKHGDTSVLLPKISQETLATSIGATRSKVNFFMNRFRKLGFIDYNERILVNKSLLSVLRAECRSRDPFGQ